MSVLVAAEFSAHEWAQWWPLLVRALPDEHLVRNRQAVQAGEIDVALVANPAPGSLQGLENLRLIQSLWAGVDRLLCDPSVPSHVPLARMVDPSMRDDMAQTALWAVLGLHRGYFDYAAQQRQGRWHQLELQRADEITVSILGLGEMGRAAAHSIALLGYSVLGWSLSEQLVSGVRTHHGAAALPSVLAQSRVVINLLPLTPSTRGLFDAHLLGQLPKGASLVNLARGAHVVESDLLESLDDGHLHRAVLDVFDTEPLPPEHPFWSHPRVTVLPHIAAPGDPRSGALIAAANVRALRAGLALKHIVERTRGY
jgi:glyoxylate/hydroxypyruvate reductase A